MVKSISRFKIQIQQEQHGHKFYFFLLIIYRDDYCDDDDDDDCEYLSS